MNLNFKVFYVYKNTNRQILMKLECVLRFQTEKELSKFKKVMREQKTLTGRIPNLLF